MREWTQLFPLLFSLLFFTFHLNGTELVLDTGKGNPQSFYVGPEDSFLDMIDNLSYYLDECDSSHYQGEIPNFRLELSVNKGKIIAKSVKNPDEPPRDYYNSLTKADKEDIGYIVRTLANNNLIKILGHKSALETAGDRVGHVHPLKFLETIFTDEELKVGIRNIQNKGGWVWSDFLDGISNSLTKEASVDNLQEEYIKDFVKNIKIDQKLLKTVLKKQDWKKFVDILIYNVPREGNPDRYDM